MASAFRSSRTSGERASAPMAPRLALLLCPLLVAAVFAPAGTVLAKPPGPAVVCDGGGAGCVVSNAYGAWGDRKQCSASAVVYPTTEEELRAAVARASRDNLKVKAVSGFSHTMPKLSCPSSAGETLLISTARYNSHIEVDVEKRVVTVDAGVGLRGLVDAVEAAGLSLVAAPYWEGVSIGGLISTGAHGSSWWGRGGAVHDHVVGLRLVVPAGRSEGFAKVVSLDGRDDALFNAARVSLGLLGLISKVTLSLESAFKRSINYSFEDDGRLEDKFMEFARAHEFADITWYPSQHKAVYRHDDRVPLNTSGDGENDFVGLQSTSILASTAVRATEKASEKARSTEGKCAMAATVVAYKWLVANGLKNRGALFTGYPVVGRQGKMQTSGSCLHSPASDALSSCAWDPRIKGLFFYETTAMFPASRFRDFLLDVKKLRDLNPDNFCGLDVYNGLLIRFVKASAAYLGQPEDSVVVDFNYFRADEPSTPRLHQDVWEELEQMAFFKYKARPHWAKNRKVAFLGVTAKYPAGLAKFQAARARLDPGRMFSSEWSEEVLLGKEGAKEDGCAMEGLCICSEDRHCNPLQGYLCRPGLVYQEARVCRYSTSSPLVVGYSTPT
ncbi:hypothetical protein Taro_051861 [Colocasia esculenta]|uniref:L-gulonolactone oxidase n=1 Tax=Colocasia esculenta TaxID=4460 RepID=A0A843XI09_COLES|nr:hypothetical protein [Colocasia esculenta]